MDPGNQAAKDQIWEQLKTYRDKMETIACASNTQISRLLKQDAEHTQLYRALCQVGLTELEIIKKEIGLDEEHLSPGYRTLSDMFSEQKDEKAEREAVQIAQQVLGECLEEADDPTDNDFIGTTFYAKLKEEAIKIEELEGSLNGGQRGAVAKALDSWLWLAGDPERFGRAITLVMEYSQRGEDWSIAAIVRKVKEEG